MIEDGKSPIQGGRYVALRTENRNPFNAGSCARHLRRVCGVCEHFRGTLTGGRARCDKLGLEPKPGADASRCEWWARKRAERPL